MYCRLWTYRKTEKRETKKQLCVNMSKRERKYCGESKNFKRYDIFFFPATLLLFIYTVIKFETLHLQFSRLTNKLSETKNKFILIYFTVFRKGENKHLNWNELATFTAIRFIISIAVIMCIPYFHYLRF